MHRVAITGLGLVTPLGIGRDRFWHALCSGACAVGPIARFDTSAYATTIAAEVRDFDAAAFLSRRRRQWTDRFSQFAVAAARLALEDAGSTTLPFPDETGVFTGSALGGVAYAEEQMDVFHAEGLRRVHPLLTLCVFGGAASSNIAIEFGITGPTISNADSCASGAKAIGEAYRAVARGDVRSAIAGGVEAPLAPLTFGAFVVARAMSQRNDEPHAASRPFDAQRDGFVMAEGAGMVLLERAGDAQARGARVYAEIVGYGSSNDAHHMSAPRADGAQTAIALKRALDEANLSPGEVEAINAHGSSTPLGDAAEAAAYGAVFGDRAAAIPICATKAQHGHALGATGAWEIAIAALGMSEGLLPGAVNLDRCDDRCALDLRRETRSLRPRVVLSNSSGFGGINAAIVLRSAT